MSTEAKKKWVVVEGWSVDYETIDNMNVYGPFASEVDAQIFADKKDEELPKKLIWMEPYSDGSGEFEIEYDRAWFEVHEVTSP